MRVAKRCCRPIRARRNLLSLLPDNTQRHTAMGKLSTSFTAILMLQYRESARLVVLNLLRYPSLPPGHTVPCPKIHPLHFRSCTMTRLHRAMTTQWGQKTPDPSPPTRATLAPRLRPARAFIGWLHTQQQHRHMPMHCRRLIASPTRRKRQPGKNARLLPPSRSSGP